MRYLALIILTTVTLVATPMVSQARDSSESSGSSHYVSGYTTSRGTYVAPYHATDPNATQRGNYSAKGNLNPYTGAVGTKIPTH
jgi:hypothetical protein